MRLLPRETSFFEDFERQGRKTVEGCQAFLAMVSEPCDIQVASRHLKDIEHQCDDITHHVVEQLHKTFITPFDRNDIYRLITRMDDIMDFVEAASQRIALYEISVMTEESRQLARCLVKGAEAVLEAVSGLRDMKNPKAILAKCIEINKLENEGDQVLRAALARLFKEEKDPIQVIKWKEIYEILESATDRCEDVANIIEGVVLEYS